MRYEKGHKDNTRQRIVEAAGERFRRDGIETVGIGSLMAGIGLTQGGFYNHFDSKDDLVREVVGSSLHEKLERMRELNAGQRHAGIAKLVDYYLSAAHRDDAAAGCTCSALAMEIARSSAPTRAAFTDELRATLALIGEQLPASLKPKPRREKAQAIFASMVGTLALARAVDDPALADDLLAAGRRAALALARVA
ncbi:MAG TPA: TetR/AcrR family transcriptional regulator [Dokdonella sp.]